MCVFITAGPITKLFAGVMIVLLLFLQKQNLDRGGEWRTCAMREDEPRPVWMSPLITHCGVRAQRRYPGPRSLLRVIALISINSCSALLLLHRPSS